MLECSYRNARDINMCFQATIVASLSTQKAAGGGGIKTGQFSLRGRRSWKKPKLMLIKLKHHMHERHCHDTTRLKMLKKRL